MRNNDNFFSSKKNKTKNCVGVLKRQWVDTFFQRDIMRYQCDGRTRRAKLPRQKPRHYCYHRSEVAASC